MKSKIYTFIIVLLVAVSALAAVCFYSEWRGMMQENAELRASLDALKAKVETLRKEWEFKNEYYNRLVSDSEFAERVIREKLGYAYPEDIVFRFKDSEPADIDDNAESEDYSAIPPAKRGLFSRIMAFLGLDGGASAAPAKPKAQAADARPAAPEFRVDMKNASVAALENRRDAAMAAESAPSNAAAAQPAAGGEKLPPQASGAAPVSQSVGLLPENPRGSLVAVSMKPVKVRLGGTNASVRQVSARAPKPVRFVGAGL